MKRLFSKKGVEFSAKYSHFELSLKSYLDGCEAKAEAKKTSLFEFFEILRTACIFARRHIVE